MSDECFNYDAMIQQFVVCRNLHPEETKIQDHGGECKKCKYVISLPDEMETSIEQKELSQTDIHLVMVLLKNKKEVQFNYNADEPDFMYIKIDLSKWSGNNG